MNINLGNVLEGALLMLVGSLSTAAWNIGKTLFKMNRDIDFAFQKIRAMEEQLKELDHASSLDCDHLEPGGKARS